jgi:hypothetical protein
MMPADGCITGTASHCGTAAGGARVVSVMCGFVTGEHDGYHGGLTLSSTSLEMRSKW